MHNKLLAHVAYCVTFYTRMDKKNTDYVKPSIFCLVTSYRPSVALSVDKN